MKSNKEDILIKMINKLKKCSIKKINKSKESITIKINK